MLRSISSTGTATSSTRPAATRLALAALLALAGATACIRSRVEITSDPPGAEVIWRGQHRGVTPVTIPFVWYWQYDLALEKPGYKRLEKLEYLRTPPWFLIPMDLFAEAMPFPITDTRYRHYTLEAAPNPDSQPATGAGTLETLTPR